MTPKQLPFLKLLDTHFWTMLGALLLLCAAGLVLQLSAGNGNFHTFAQPQLLKILVGLVVFLIVYSLPPNIIYNNIELLYGAGLVLVVLVEILGKIHLGAQRWLKIGGLIAVQPSELIKITVILMASKLLCSTNLADEKPTRFLLPLIITLLPCLLIILQPDLGTACIIIVASAAMIFVAGVPLRYAGLMMLVILIAAPLIWFNLYKYQQARILTFLNPNRDPLGSGYHIIQAKIAIGSGGLLGKGYLQGTQTKLDFIPEKQTDFIFALLTEEFGFLGAVFIIFLYLSVSLYSLYLGLKSKIRFVNYTVIGLTAVFFTQVFFNIAMVSGLLPVVGIPLPLLSFGGTSILTIFASFAIILRFSREKDDTTFAKN